jgi:hypothetical protein
MHRMCVSGASEDCRAAARGEAARARCKSGHLRSRSSRTLSCRLCQMTSTPSCDELRAWLPKSPHPPACVVDHSRLTWTILTSRCDVRIRLRMLSAWRGSGRVLRSARWPPIGHSRRILKAYVSYRARWIVSKYVAVVLNRSRLSHVFLAEPLSTRTRLSGHSREAEANRSTER